MREELTEAIRRNQELYGIDLSDEAVRRLGDFYGLLQEENPILHLVAPCSPEEFATRHILESLTLLRHLPEGSHFADIGPGGGLPSIPCLVARDDLTAVLIESKEKKSKFLERASSHLFAPGRVEVINSQFEEVRRNDLRIVSCRALDKFVDKLPRLIRWSKNAKLLLFGGNTLREELDKLHIEYDTQKMPLSEQRFLFVSKKRHKHR